LRGEHDSEQRDRAHENGGECGNFVRKSPRRCIAVDRDFLRKRGDECCRERAFGKQIAQQIRQSKCHQEGVKIPARTEKTGKHHLADQSENATRENRHAHDSRRARASSPIFSRSHRRTKNSVRRFTKAKTSRVTAIVKVVALRGLAAVARAATLELFDLIAARSEHRETSVLLFQKEIHAVEVDDAMTVV
jgi:hypothetical protein